MKCIIPGNNIRVFGRAIHSLSKIGDELYIEPLDHGLALRTVNSSRSAYACFLFAPSFFQHYDDGADEVSSQDSDDTLRCKIAMKSILTVFRSLPTMEKTVERCMIRLNMKDSRLVFQLYCRHGIVKTHNLAFIECETLQAVFSKDLCPNALTASSKLLCDAVMNFQNNQEEVTLIVNPEKIVLKNYVDDEPDPNKVMHTNLSLEPDEFDNCQIGVDTEVTFCLKELRAILAFSEATTLPLTLNFETAGRPIVFTIDSDSTFEGNFVLATLADQQSQRQASTQARPATQKRTQSRTSKTISQRSRSSSISYGATGENGDNPQSMRKKGGSNDIERSQRLESAYDELMNDDDDFDEMMIQNDTTMAVQQTEKSNKIERLCNTENVSGVNSLRTINTKGDNSVRNSRNNSPVPGCSKSNEESPVIPVLGSKVKIADTSVMDDVPMDGVDQEEEDELVPGTPPAKRFRSLFFGSSQTSTQSQTQPKTANLSVSRVLAQDSDEED